MTRASAPFGVAAQENGVGKSVSCNMLGRNRIPSVMFKRYPRLIADRLEANCRERELAGNEALLPPSERKSDARFPRRNSADLKNVSSWRGFDETSVRTRLEGQRRASFA